MPKFRLNRLRFPSDLRENLEFLYANQDRFSGDAFDFDYHLMWEPFKDLAGVKLAEVIHDDVRALKDLGLNGMVSCQIQKAFMPHGLGIYAMGRTLENSDVDFDRLRKEYLSAAFGDHVSSVVNILQIFYDCHCPEYLRNEHSEIDARQAEAFDNGADRLREGAKQLRFLRKEESDKTVDLSLKLLAYYCELCAHYFLALGAKARGEAREKVRKNFPKCINFYLRTNPNTGIT